MKFLNQTTSQQQTEPPKTGTCGRSAAHTASSVSRQRGDGGVALPLLQALVPLDEQRVALAVDVPLQAAAGLLQPGQRAPGLSQPLLQGGRSAVQLPGLLLQAAGERRKRRSVASSDVPIDTIISIPPVPDLYALKLTLRSYFSYYSCEARYFITIGTQLKVTKLLRSWAFEWNCFFCCLV